MSAATLALGPSLRLPVAAVTRTIAVVGQKGTGKTSTAVVIVEEAAAAGARFAWMDPTGAASGLRSNAAGDGPGVDCVVMGGFHGDVPLDPGAGEVVARLVVEEGYSVVCDLERMPRSRQIVFVADFAEAALELCRSAVTVVVDEAPRFVPQSGGGGSKQELEDLARCKRAVTEVVMLGRRKGLGSVLISQRPAKLHKDVLEQADVLIAHRLMGNNDRTAIAGWLEEYGEEADAWLNRLPKLRVGEAVALAPEYELAGVFSIRMKRTFDSSATPDVGAVLLDAPRGRAEIDLGELEAKMGHALEQAQENDPEALRRRIKRLEAKLAEGGNDDRELRDLIAAALAGENVTADDDPLAFDVAVLQAAWDEMHREAGAWRALHVDLTEKIGDVAGLLEDFTPAGAVARDAPARTKEVQTVAASSRPAEVDRSRDRGSNGDERAPSSTPAGGGNAVGPGGAGELPGPPIKAGAKRMLEALLDAPRPLNRSELSTLAVVRKGGTMSDYLSALRLHGLIVENGNGIALADRPAAIRALGLDRRERRPRAPWQIVDPHNRGLKAGARRMLEHLMRSHPDGYTRSELSRLADVSKGGTFSDYLSSLKTRGLAEERAKRVYAGAVLYIWSDR